MIGCEVTMDRNRDLPALLRKAADQSSEAMSDALGWRMLLTDAADEIDRLRNLLRDQNESAAPRSAMGIERS
jgi:hypothetical protein